MTAQTLIERSRNVLLEKYGFYHGKLLVPFENLAFFPVKTVMRQAKPVI